MCSFTGTSVHQILDRSELEFNPNHVSSFSINDMGDTMKKTFRVVSRAANGSFMLSDFLSEQSLTREFEKVGMDDCSTDLSLRGLPVLSGLIGPMADGPQVVRYETPAVFEDMTKEWSYAPTSRRSKDDSLETTESY